MIAREPACGIPAPDSSGRLASAPLLLWPAVRLACSSPGQTVRNRFPLRAASSRQSLPPVNGVTVSEYYGLIRLPATFGSPT